MNYSTLEEAMEQAGWDQQIDAVSVYRAFEHIEDGRHKRGVRYSVALILTLIVLAKLAGMTTQVAIAEWVRLRAGWLSQVLPCAYKGFPCAATYGNVLRAVDVEQVRQVINDWLSRLGATQRCGQEPSRLLDQEQEREAQVHVALDGKTRRRNAGP